MKKLVLLMAVVVLFAACGRGGDDEEQGAEETHKGTSCSAPVDQNGSPAPTPTPGFALGKAILQGADGSVLVNVEIAETPEQQAQGLMFRTNLDADCGMLFIFFEEHSGGFYMKNTLIPLSIAFMDVEGKIVKIIDMDPCEADPCEIYDPGVPYFAALEVNQGSFDEWQVSEGDTVEVVQNSRNETLDLD